LIRVITVITLVVSLGSIPAAGKQPSNWVGQFDPCHGSSELRKADHMDLGVRISTVNPILANEFRHALDFWSDIIDMSWHLDNTFTCSIQLVDGTPDIFTDGTFAKSQFTEWGHFQGWVAFDPRATLTPTEMYYGSIHEIGHMLGLTHNPSPQSVMSGVDYDGSQWLDDSDLHALAARHRLRGSQTHLPVR